MEDDKEELEFDKRPIRFNDADRMLFYIMLGFCFFISYQIWGDKVVNAISEYFKHLIPF